MYFLIFFVVFVIAYVRSFKDDFKKEDIEKVSPILTLAVIIITVTSIVTALLG